MISVIIPVFNVKPYLEKCIESVIYQTYKDLEIIIVDDGSNDGSEEICDKYAELDQRIIVIHQENKGLSNARNKGLDIATGEWIAFLDSDDWIEPEMYSTLLSVGEKSGADICSCQTRMIYQNGVKCIYDKSIKEFQFDQIIEELITQRYIRFEVWNKIWKRTLIGSLRFKDGQVSEDVYFDFQMFRKANKLVHIDLPLHNYLAERPGNTNSSFKSARLCVFDEFDDFMSIMSKEGNNKAYQMLGCMGASFAISIYKEAFNSSQSKEIKKTLYDKFQHYYRIPGIKQYKSIKGRMNWYIFSFSPTLYIYMNRLVNIRKMMVKCR